VSLSLTCILCLIWSCDHFSLVIYSYQGGWRWRWVQKCIFAKGLNQQNHFLSSSCKVHLLHTQYTFMGSLIEESRWQHSISNFSSLDIEWILDVKSSWFAGWARIGKTKQGFIYIYFSFQLSINCSLIE